MPNITTCLWFDGQAEEAAQLYTSIFPDSKVDRITHYLADMPGQEGTVMTVEFSLDGKPFLGLNGGPGFPFSEAVSFQIFCADQAEVDYYWDALIAGGGQPSECGWLKDKFGVSWQVTPTRLMELVTGPDREVAARVTECFMKMSKLDIAEIERAAAG